jgi:hypothetical protein
MSGRSRGCREILVCGTLAVALSFLWIWPQVLNLRQIPDRGDPIFSAWRLARVAHQLRTDPTHLYDGNIFYPRRWTLAYSDATLLQGVLGAPFILAGVEPLLVANTLLVLAFPLCALAFFYSGWRLTGSAPAGLVAGVFGAWHPFHAEHFSHLELQWFMFAPLAIVGVLETAVAPTWRKGCLVGLLIALQSLASMYFGLMLASALVPIGAIAVWRRGGVAPRTLAAALAGLLVVVAPVAALLAIPYRQARAEHGERPQSEIELGSARPGDYLKTSRKLTTYGWNPRAANLPERELFPGTTTLALAGAGLASATVPLMAGGAAAFDWSLGRHGLTYRWLAAAVPPYRSVRVPARFSALLGTILILLGAWGARRILTGRTRRAQYALAAAMVAAIGVDSRLTLELRGYDTDIPAFYARLGPESIVASLPSGHEIDYMYFSTSGWNQMLKGYSGFIPLDDEAEGALARVPEPSSIDLLRSRGATHLTYVCAFERSEPRCEYNLAALAGSPRLELVAEEEWQGTPARVYRLK